MKVCTLYFEYYLYEEKNPSKLNKLYLTAQVKNTHWANRTNFTDILEDVSMHTSTSSEA